MKDTAPIILFVYNRPEHTKRTLDALAANHLAPASALFIYIDGIKQGAGEKDIKNSQEVKKIAEAEKRFKNTTIITADVNKGLARSIIEGVTDTLRSFDKVIVLEDDLETSVYFLNFMNDTLDLYASANEVACISGYIYPVADKLPETFFIRGADCWGWGTWKRAWDLFEPDGKYLLDQLTKMELLYDFNFYDSYPYAKMLKDQIEGKNSSWAVRWYASAYLHEKLTLYPSTSFVRNIGFDGTGTHSGKRDFWRVDDLTKKIHVQKMQPTEDENAKQVIARYFNVIMKRSLSKRVKYALRSILNRFS